VDSSRRHGVKFENVNVINFANKTFIKTCNACDPANPETGLGMVPNHFKGMTFTNASFSTFILFNNPLTGKDLIVDEDGSLFSKLAIAGITKGFITPFFKHLENASCQTITDTSICSDTCLACPDTIQIERLDV
jgi:hypothetical protein